MAFSVKQRTPTTIEAAVGFTPECESFLIRSNPVNVGAVAPVHLSGY